MTKHIAQQNLIWTLSDISAMTKRNLLHYVRLPQLVVFSTIQPVMFLLLFAYVFGGAIQTSSKEYITYLLPGIIVQTAVFGALGTGIGLAVDLSKGMVDRFRSLPMARSAVLAGRTIADSVRNIFTTLLMIGVGYLIGFRFEQNIGRALLAFGLTILFGFVFSWISAAIGILSKNIETAQSIGFVWVFPLVFASSIFVPVESMPDWLQGFARHNPISVTVNAVRAMASGASYSSDLWQSLAWMAGILIVFVPLSIYLYRKS